MKEAVYRYIGQEEFFYECISIIHGKLILSPEYFKETISHSVVQTFSFFNQINRLLFCGIRDVGGSYICREFENNAHF